MMQRMQWMERLHPVEETNELLERVKRWVSAGTVHVALSVASGNALEQNQALSVYSTHRGVTPDDVQVHDRLRIDGGATYVVDYVIPGRPYSQLFLTLEEPIPKHLPDPEEAI